MAEYPESPIRPRPQAVDHSAQDFQTPQIGIDERNQAFKSLIQDIAERLGQDEVNMIVYQRNLPQKDSNQSGLNLLMQLERDGVFSPHNIDSLTELLKEIRRHDLVTNFADVYWQRYGESATPGRCYSAPSQSNPRVVHYKTTRPVSYPDASLNLPRPIQESTDHADTNSVPLVKERQSLVSDQKLAMGTLPDQRVSEVQNSPHMRIPHGKEAHVVHSGVKHMHSHSFPRIQPSPGSVPESRGMSPSVRTRPLSDMPHTTFQPSDFALNHQIFTQEQQHQQQQLQHKRRARHRKRHSLDFSYRHLRTQENPSFHTEMFPTLPQVDPARGSTDAVMPLSSFSHEQRPPSVFSFSGAPTTVSSKFSSRQSITPMPSHLSSSQQYSPQLSSTNSDMAIHPFSPGHDQVHFVSGKRSSSLSISRCECGLVISPPGYTTSQLPAHSSMGSIQPWISASNDLLTHGIAHAHCWGMQGDHDQNDPSASKCTVPPLKGDVPSVSSGSLPTSLKKLELQPSSLRSRSWPKRLGLTIARKHSHDTILRWQIKRNRLNKAIYKHKENKCFTCTEKLILELDSTCGKKSSPKLVFTVYPCGLDEDRNKNVTLQVDIEVPRKCPRLPDCAEVKVFVVAYDTRESRELTDEHVVIKKANLRNFLVHKFVGHESLKNSYSDYIEVRASANLIMEPDQ